MSMLLMLILFFSISDTITTDIHAARWELAIAGFLNGTYSQKKEGGREGGKK